MKKDKASLKSINAYWCSPELSRDDRLFRALFDELPHPRFMFMNDIAAVILKLGRYHEKFPHRETHLGKTVPSVASVCWEKLRSGAFNKFEKEKSFLTTMQIDKILHGTHLLRDPLSAEEWNNLSDAVETGIAYYNSYSASELMYYVSRLKLNLSSDLGNKLIAAALEQPFLDRKDQFYLAKILGNITDAHIRVHEDLRPLILEQTQENFGCFANSDFPALMKYFSFNCAVPHADYQDQLFRHIHARKDSMEDVQLGRILFDTAALSVVGSLSPFVRKACGEILDDLVFKHEVTRLPHIARRNCFLASLALKPERARSFAGSKLKQPVYQSTNSVNQVMAELGCARDHTAEIPELGLDLVYGTRINGKALLIDVDHKNRFNDDLENSHESLAARFLYVSALIQTARPEAVVLRLFSEDAEKIKRCTMARILSDVKTFPAGAYLLVSNGEAQGHTFHRLPQLDSFGQPPHRSDKVLRTGD